MKRIRFRHKQVKQQPKEIFPVNEKIRVPEVQVIDENGQLLGVIPTNKAIIMAKQRDLDLVEVSPKAQPPVAKFLDYGSFKYQKEKSFKKQKAQQKKSDLKEIRISPRIGKHDLEIRLKQAEKFLKRGDKVNIEAFLKGRERQHPELAKNIIDDFIKLLNQAIEIKIEQEPKKQGNKFIAIIQYQDKNEQAAANEA